MARSARTYRAARRNWGWGRITPMTPEARARKHELQLKKRAHQRAMLASLVWAPPRPWCRKAPRPRPSGSALLTGVQVLGKILGLLGWSDAHAARFTRSVPE